MSKGSGNFAALLRVAIEKSGKPIPEIADLAGVSRQAIHLILNGDRMNPNWETVCALAKVLGVPTDYFRK